MRQIILYCIVLYCIFSCKRIEPSIEKPVFLKEKKDSIEQKFISLINKRDSTSKKEISFLERLSNFNKEELPFKFHAYLLDSLYNEGDFSRNIHFIKREYYDSIKSIGNVFSKHSSLPKFKHDFYNLLFLGDSLHGGKCCQLNDEVIFKRLKTFDRNIEMFLTLNSFSDTAYTRGVLLSFVTYNIKEDRQIDKKVISMSGSGFDNTEYYEGFVVYKDSIVVKGYVYTEPEMNIINKRFYISKKGLIKFSYNIELISNEEK